MAKVTYLFGAGASALEMPVVDAIPGRLREFIEYLGKSDSYPVSSEWRGSAPPVIAELQALHDKLVVKVKGLKKGKPTTSYKKLHSSIDTYAKKLMIQGKEEELEKLKFLLSLFFCFEQTRKRVDLRYDSFFASIIKKSAYDLPKSVNIISWNYDSQFEIAYRNFTEMPDLSENSRHLRIHTKFIERAFEESEFSIFKINGTAALFDKNRQKTKLQYLFNIEENLADNIISWYEKWENPAEEQNIRSAISFAWEDDNSRRENIIEVAKKAIKDSTVLVIIGYSFPFFNQEIDKILINEMKLKKVYIQSPEASAVKERFLAICETLEDDIILKDNTDQFLLPNELTL